MNIEEFSSPYEYWRVFITLWILKSFHHLMNIAEFFITWWILMSFHHLMNIEEFSSPYEYWWVFITLWILKSFHHLMNIAEFFITWWILKSFHLLMNIDEFSSCAYYFKVLIFKFLIIDAHYNLNLVYILDFISSNGPKLKKMVNFKNNCNEKSIKFAGPISFSLAKGNAVQSETWHDLNISFVILLLNISSKFHLLIITQ